MWSLMGYSVQGLEATLEAMSRACNTMRTEKLMQIAPSTAVDDNAIIDELYGVMRCTSPARGRHIFNSILDGTASKMGGLIL